MADPGLRKRNGTRLGCCAMVKNYGIMLREYGSQFKGVPTDLIWDNVNKIGDSHVSAREQNTNSQAPTFKWIINGYVWEKESASLQQKPKNKQRRNDGNKSPFGKHHIKHKFR